MKAFSNISIKENMKCTNPKKYRCGNRRPIFHSHLRYIFYKYIRALCICTV